MSVNVTLAQILHLAPNTQPNYKVAFQNAQSVLEQHAISGNPLRVAHFIAQILHESGGFTIQFENLNYSVERLPVVWPSRFKPEGPLNPADYAHNPQALANVVYADRMGNHAPNDGFTYRGRGLLQLTGKASYQEATDLLHKENPRGPDFVAEPDLVASAEWSLIVAASKWASLGCNALADKDDLQAVTRAINGGVIGLSERAECLKCTKAVWC